MLIILIPSLLFVLGRFVVSLVVFCVATTGLVFLLGLVLLHHCACISCRHTDILLPRRWLLHQQHMAKPTRQAALHTTHSVSALFSLKDEMHHL